MLKKIISGGQTGADIAGIATAKIFGLETGGWMPKGFRTQNGPRPEFAELYGIQEHSSPNYPPRTYANVKDSDGTLRLAHNLESSGERLTLKAINQYRKPHRDIDLKNPLSVSEIVTWLQEKDIVVLNIAGNSEKTAPGITLEVADYLRQLFKLLGLVEQYGIERKIGETGLGNL